MKILVAVDGSDHSYDAIRALKHLARADELLLVHVLDVPMPAYPMMMPEVTQELYATAERTMREDGSRLLDRIASLIPLDAGPVTKQLVVGSPAEQIVALAESHRVDLALLGTRGMGPIKERLVGSVAHRVLTFAPGAKLILPCPLKALQNILLPLQGTSDAQQAIRFLGLKPFRGTPVVTLLTVLPHTKPPWPVEASLAERMEADAMRNAKVFLGGIATQIAALGYGTKVMVTLGAPVEGILQTAQTANVDLILAGSRGRRGVTRLVLGSVSHALLHQGHSPVLIFE